MIVVFINYKHHLLKQNRYQFMEESDIIVNKVQYEK